MSATIPLKVNKGEHGTQWEGTVNHTYAIFKLVVKNARPGDQLEVRLDSTPMGCIVIPPPQHGPVRHGDSIGEAVTTFDPPRVVPPGVPLHMGYRAADDDGREVYVEVHALNP